MNEVSNQKHRELFRCGGCYEIKDDVEVRYSYGIYAGKFCVKCARRKFRDQCGLRGEGQGSPREMIEMGEDYYGDEDW